MASWILIPGNLMKQKKAEPSPAKELRLGRFRNSNEPA
jgi:hypothetical protein